MEIQVSSWLREKTDNKPSQVLYEIYFGSSKFIFNKEEVVDLFCKLDLCLGGKVISEAIRDARIEAVREIMKNLQAAALNELPPWDREKV